MTTKHPVQSLETVKAGLWERRRTLGNWEAVASEIGVSLGTTVRVANGYEPKQPAIREALGLPVTAPAPVCPKCGVVHIRKTCPPAGPRKPRRNVKAIIMAAFGLPWGL